MFSKHFEKIFAAASSCSYTANGKNLSEDEALERFYKMLNIRGIVYVIGNGGSAGIASHFSNDLMRTIKIPSQTLFDANLMTCVANDFGYENVFSYPLDKLLTPNDLLVAISSSGKSPNILRSAYVAMQKDTPLITLSGFQHNNPLRQLGCLNFWINQCDYGLVETAHFFILHTIIDLWNKTSAQTVKYAEVH